MQGENKNFDLPVKKKTDICTIMYTSGTTGDPKGVMISNNSIITMIAGVKRLLGSVNESVIAYLFGFLRSLKLSVVSKLKVWNKCKLSFILQLTEHDIYLSYLPLAHIFDRVIEECFINCGGAIGFWRGVSCCCISKPAIE